LSKLPFLIYSFVSSLVLLYQTRRAAPRATRSFEHLDIYRPCVGGPNSKRHQAPDFRAGPGTSTHDSWVQTSSCFFGAFFEVSWFLSKVLLALKSRVLLSGSVVYSALAKFSFSLGRVVQSIEGAVMIAQANHSRTLYDWVKTKLRSCYVRPWVRHVPPLHSEFPATPHQDLSRILCSRSAVPLGVTPRLFRTLSM